MNEDDYDTTAQSDERQDGTSFTRRRVIGGLAGAGLLSAGLIRFANAQVTDATPEASPAATVTTGTGGTTSQRTAPTANATQAIERATTAIAAVSADRDAVAWQVQTQTVDAVLAQATKVRDAAQSASSSDATGAVRLAMATALAARRVLIASLTYAGLPSQEARASRVLAEAHDLIARAGQQTATVSGVDVAFYATTAQTLYATAYDEYGKKAYARAAATARAAVELASIPEMLAASEQHRNGGPRRRGRRGRRRDGGFGPQTSPDDNTGQDDDTGQDTPVIVPAPEF